MDLRVLTEEAYLALKKKLHQAHDKLIKSTLLEEEAKYEFFGKIVMPLLNGLKINLDNLQLDTTAYIKPNLQVFYSDIVYLTDLIDETTQKKEPIKIALLIEHKSEMPSQMALRVQILEYVSSIMRMNYNKDTDKTIPVLPIIFNQFDKGWKPESFRSLFPEVSDLFSRYIPEFGLLVINLAELPDEILASLDEYGLLKATLLAMKNVRNKAFLKLHFEEIFLFLQKHPDKTPLRDRLIVYLLGQSTMTAQEIEELLQNIFSPVLKQEIMVATEGFIEFATRHHKAASDAAILAAKKSVKDAKAKAKADVAAATAAATLQARNRLTVIHGWHGGVSIDLISNMSTLPKNEVMELIAVFEKVKNHCVTGKDTTMGRLKNLSGLEDAELTTLLELLKQ